MSKPLVQFRLSDDEMELLKSLSEDGESEGLTAKRLLLQALGVSKKDTPQQLSEELKTYIAEEVEYRAQAIIDSSNDMLKRLQEEIKLLSVQVAYKVEQLQVVEEPKATQTRRTPRRKKSTEEGVPSGLEKAKKDVASNS